MFQSTRPRGARLRCRQVCDVYARVSIHAPARGATPLQGFIAHAIQFQSTRPRGARLATGYKGAYEAKFQSTRPRGARPECELHFRHFERVSIHAPARGATVFSQKSRHPDKFQSTRPRGARQCDRCLPGCCLWFQSTRPRGARPAMAVRIIGSSDGFNPRARAGRDRQAVVIDTF